MAASAASVRAVHDCWNRIGVRGDGSCPELARHVHCRNCPVHAAAAGELLDLPLPDDHLARWTPLVASRQARDAEADALSLVIFRLGEEWLALPTGSFREVVGTRSIHSIPHRRDGVVLGLANIRGELVACASLQQLLGLEPAARKKGERQRILDGRVLVIEHEGTRTAFPVDEVHEVRRFRPSELGPVPTTLARTANVYIKAVLSWQGQSVGLLDEQLLLFTVNRSLTLATT
jgi:chemotaxis-related protein WspD